MLVLGRQQGNQIDIGPDIRITVVSIRGDRVKIGIDAPAIVNIKRTEIPDRRKETPITEDYDQQEAT